MSLKTRLLYHLDHSTNLATMTTCFILAVTGLIMSVWYTSSSLEENKARTEAELEQFEDHMIWYLYSTPYKEN